MAIVKKSLPYANALFKLALEKNLLDAIRNDAIALKGAVTESVEFKDLISNPTYSKTRVKELLSKIFTGKLQNDTLLFLNLLVDKGRVSGLKSICEAYIDLANKSENKMVIKLTSAYQLSDDTISKIATSMLGNQKYEVETTINPSLIGGYIAEIDNKILDNSISNRIQKLKQSII